MKTPVTARIRANRCRICKGVGLERWLTPKATDLVACGLQVGIGTGPANGCTSERGDCGISRLSPRHYRIGGLSEVAFERLRSSCDAESFRHQGVLVGGPLLSGITCPDPRIDCNLVIESVPFQVCWELSGLRPVPALSSISFDGLGRLRILAAMLAGIVAAPPPR